MFEGRTAPRNLVGIVKHIIKYFVLIIFFCSTVHIPFGSHEQPRPTLVRETGVRVQGNHMSVLLLYVLYDRRKG